MQLELNTDQYRVLLEMVFMGNWMANVMESEEDVRKYDALEELLFEQADRFGLTDLVEDRTYPSEQFLDSIFPVIDHYNELNFWEHLVELMAQRDLLQKYGEAAWEGLSNEERFAQVEKLKEQYFAVLEKSGLKALKLEGTEKP